MTTLIYISWALIGSVLAVLFIKSQNWSVTRIDPDKQRFSMFIVLGGAVLRWLLFSLALILSLNHSIGSAIGLFTTFIFVRLIILFKSNKLLIIG